MGHASGGQGKVGKFCCKVRREDVWYRSLIVRPWFDWVDVVEYGWEEIFVSICACRVLWCI